MPVYNTLIEVLEALKKDNIPITKRTFEHYQSMNLLPKPIRKVGDKGRGVLGLYSHKLPDIVKKIIDYKKEGLTLREIEEKAKNNILERVRNNLKKGGFSGYRLQEKSRMLDKFEGLTPVNMAIQDARLSLNHLTTGDILSNLYWWDSDSTVEEWTHEYFINELNRTICAKSTELVELEEEENKEVRKDGKDVLNSLIEKCTKRIIELRGLKQKVEDDYDNKRGGSDEQ